MQGCNSVVLLSSAALYNHYSAYLLPHLFYKPDNKKGVSKMKRLHL